MLAHPSGLDKTNEAVNMAAYHVIIQLHLTKGGEISLFCLKVLFKLIQWQFP